MEAYPPHAGPRSVRRSGSSAVDGLNDCGDGGRMRAGELAEDLGYSAPAGMRDARGGASCRRANG